MCVCLSACLPVCAALPCPAPPHPACPRAEFQLASDKERKGSSGEHCGASLQHLPPRLAASVALPLPSPSLPPPLPPPPSPPVPPSSANNRHSLPSSLTYFLSPSLPLTPLSFPFVSLFTYSLLIFFLISYCCSFHLFIFLSFSFLSSLFSSI